MTEDNTADFSEQYKEREASKLLTNEEKQAEAYEKMKDILMTLLEPVVVDLCNHVRTLEYVEPGRGKSEVEKLYLLKEINTPMYNILIDSLKDITVDYDLNLDSSKYFKDIMNEQKSTK